MRKVPSERNTMPVRTRLKIKPHLCFKRRGSLDGDHGTTRGTEVHFKAAVLLCLHFKAAFMLCLRVIEAPSQARKRRRVRQADGVRRQVQPPK